MVNLTGEETIRCSFAGRTVRQGAVYMDLRESKGKKHHDEERWMVNSKSEGAEVYLTLGPRINMPHKWGKQIESITKFIV